MPIARRSQPLAQVAVALLTAFCLLAFPAATFGQRGAITAPRNLAQLVDESSLIVRGQVISARVEPHPQFSSLWTVVVTLQVAETLKGQISSNTYTFRQYIWDPQDRSDAAGYRKGGQLLLLLIKPSAYGLSSPAGLEQGRFQIRSDSGGRPMATNGRGNIGLFQGVAARAAANGIRLSARSNTVVNGAGRGAVGLDDLRTVIRDLAGTNP